MKEARSVDIRYDDEDEQIDIRTQDEEVRAHCAACIFEGAGIAGLRSTQSFLIGVIKPAQDLSSTYKSYSHDLLPVQASVVPSENQSDISEHRRCDLAFKPPNRLCPYTDAHFRTHCPHVLIRAACLSNATSISFLKDNRSASAPNSRPLLTTS